ncbi:hypothetical protein DTO166G4_1401 [Paecilomyces variotii]|nr:hypothetical protein DTO166G4_1401 [Paecilomyces variotii]KAJ9226236.1 hypothetical protein DTO169C6_1449 [Paecilomyces variotii]KAJ9242719.1 hypothetical protein DTO166G5_474 [Paecilomyces variotii]KAJ9266482.1 hypothetical protein DTO195F2_1005 [Paecilomyces variotii]KAJ9289211.1 hypothetical protein DTO021C3_3037 [Paecilomyces variotii]
MIRSRTITSLLLLILSLLSSPALAYGSSSSSQKPPGKNAILLSNVHTLTLRGDRTTTGRRLSPIPQLTCTGPSKRICNLYPIETMRCTNVGYDYDKEDVQWTCTADLPPEFKLGSTDVVCEGYRDSDDPWVLKGSCGVEYRLLLTELGERRFGDIVRKEKSGWDQLFSVVFDLLFFAFICGVILVILTVIVRDCFGLGNRDGRRNDGRGGPGGYGGGGDGGYPPGPPPPYDYPSSGGPWYKPTYGQGWRPGFWTGALGGTALGYEMGRRNQGGFFRPGPSRPRRYDYDDPGEGSSRSPSFTTTTSSTGFGSTRRR